MTNQEMIARGLGTVANTTGLQSKQTTQTTQNTSPWDTIGNILSSSASALNNFNNSYINAQLAAANSANTASAYAQKQQFEYNKQLMDLQNTKQDEYFQRMMDFNANSAAQANAFTEKMWDKAADYNTNMFNAEQAFNQMMWDKTADYNTNMWNKTAQYNTLEAEKQRAWQEQMSATAYQRAIKDMKAAGINPILAASNGGANIGSGATASMSSGSIGSTTASGKNMGASSGAQASTSGASAAGGSVGNYTGQGYHLSETMAIFGSVLGTLGEALSAFQAGKAKNGSNIIKDVADVGQSIATKIEKASQETKNELKEYNNKYGDSFWDWMNARNYEYWHGKDTYKKGTYGFTGTNGFLNTGGHKF